MSTQLTLDLPGLQAIATSREAAETFIDDGTRYAAPGNAMLPAPVVLKKTIEFNRIPYHPWLDVPLAEREAEQHEYEMTSDGWDE